MRHAAPAIVILALALGGCSSVADVPLLGVPSNAPARPETPGAYLPVHDLPPPRQEEVLSVTDQTRIEKELSDARSKAKATAKTNADAIAAAPPAKQPARQKAAKGTR